MTRLEENGILVNKVIEKAKSEPSGPYEEMVVFQLGVMASMLVDISKSLAILADKGESE